MCRLFDYHEYPETAMSLTVSCGKCGKRFAAPDKLAGTTVKCPNCKAPIDVPAMVEPLDDLAPLDPLGGLSDE